MSMFFKISLFMSIIIISMLLMIPLSNAIIFSSIYYLGKKINDTRIEIIQSTRETSRKFKSSEFQAMNETSLTA